MCYFLPILPANLFAADISRWPEFSLLALAMIQMGLTRKIDSTKKGQLSIKWDKGNLLEKKLFVKC